MFVNRSRDWVDIEEMLTAGTFDAPRALSVIATRLGPSDERAERLVALSRRVHPPDGKTER